MRRRVPWGSVFLVFALVGWVVATFVVPGEAALRPWLRAFFDASLVGALADWFAVTALFRRPLGLPLPHTDLLVKKKDELARALPEFLATFLAPESLGPVWASLDYAGVLEAHLTPSAWRELAGDPAAREWGDRTLKASLDLLQRELRAHQDELVGPVTDLIKRNAGWKGLFVGREAVAEVFEGLVAEVGAVRDRRDHPLRPALQRALSEALVRWTTESPPWGSTPHERDDFNRRAGELAATVWQRTRAAEKLTAALTYVLQRTDARSLSERIRQAVGADLQAIRVNGALVGGLAGVLLHALTQLMVAE